MKTSRRMKDGRVIMDIDYTTEVVTPHVPWGVPYHKGALKAFFMPGVKTGRDFVELMERLQIDAVSVTHDRAWDLDKWGFGDFYDKRVRIWEYETVYGYMVDALTSDQWYDVMVVTGVNGWGYWPKEARQAILRRVKEGAGLVIVHPFDGAKKTAELAELSPLVGCPNDKVDDGGYAVIRDDKLKSAEWRPAGKHFITEHFPFDAMAYDEMAYYPYKAAGEVIMAADNGDPIAAVKKVGKGRVVAFGWYNRDLAPQHKEHVKPVGGLSSNSDFWRGGFSRLTWNSNEYIFSMLAKAAVWAAGKDSQADFEAKVTGSGDMELAVKVKSAGLDNLSVSAQIVNQWGNEELILSEPAGDGETVKFTLPEEVLAGGAEFAHIILKQGDASVNWGAVKFDVEVDACVVSIATDKEIYKPKDKVTATIKLEAGALETRLEVVLVGAFGRVVSKHYESVSGSKEVKVTLPREGIVTPQMWVRARLTREGRLLCEKQSARLMAVPDYDRNIHDAELVVAQYDRGRGDYVEPVRRQLLKFGATGGYYGYSKILAESGAEGGGIYWYHRDPYTARKEKYFRTGDKKYLERVPCLDDPAFQKKMHDKIVATAALGTKYAPLSYYVQDEGSLTCYRDENDLCFGKHTLTAMRAWLKKEYKDIKKLNAEWGTKFSSWAKVTPMTIDEAREHGNFAPWADHRTYMEMTFARNLELVRDSVGEVDPGARIRLSGLQVSSSYTGMDYWRLHQMVEYFEAYGGGNQYEFHLSFQKPRTILGNWIGYGQMGGSSNHKIWDAFLHQIRLFSVFWEFCVVNPDFTLSGSALDMQKTFKELRGSGVSKMLFDAERDNTGVAVHYSYPSIHAAQAQGKHVRFDKERQGWLNVLQALGYQQNFVARQQIEAGDLVKRKFKVLIMPMSMAIGAKEAAAIKQFVKAGGAVVADFQTGIMDDHCKRLKKGVLDDLFGIVRLNMRNENFFINGEPRVTGEMPKVNVKMIEDTAVIQEEPGVRTKGGKALLRDDFSHNVPSIVVNKYGKGTAAYLNFATDVCVGGDEDKARAVTEAVGELMRLFKVKPIMQVRDGQGKRLDKVEMFRYRQDGVEYYAMLRENVAGSQRLAYDGIVRAGEETDVAAEKIAIALPKKGHLYDCLAKKYLGVTDSVDTEIGSAQAKVYGVYPYKINDLKVAVEADNNVVEYSVEVVVSGGKPKRHAVVLKVVSPSGEVSQLYSVNMTAKGGKAKGKVVFSLEGESGGWKFAFTEAASGIKKAVEVMVP